MIKYRNKGFTINFDIDAYGYKKYTIECTYIYVKEKDKYSLTMGLTRRDVMTRLNIGNQHIDTQLITSSKEEIRNDIAHIVGQAIASGYFDKYIKNYEYMIKCFDKGNEIFEGNNAE